MVGKSLRHVNMDEDKFSESSLSHGPTLSADDCQQLGVDDVDRVVGESNRSIVSAVIH